MCKYTPPTIRELEERIARRRALVLEDIECLYNELSWLGMLRTLVRDCPPTDAKRRELLKQQIVNP